MDIILQIKRVQHQNGRVRKLFDGILILFIDFVLILFKIDNPEIARIFPKKLM